MDPLLERLLYFGLGCGLGFIVGYIVSNVKKHNERGEIKRPKLASIGLAMVVGITVLAAFQTGHVNGELDHTTSCITQYNTRLGESLASRDAAIKAGTQAEIDLWSKYNRLYALAKSDPKQIPVAQEKLNKAIHKYVETLVHLQKTREQNPYPNPDILKDCKEN